MRTRTHENTHSHETHTHAGARTQQSNSYFLLPALCSVVAPPHSRTHWKPVAMGWFRSEEMEYIKIHLHQVRERL
jgi:hypothetical protein